MNKKWASLIIASCAITVAFSQTLFTYGDYSADARDFVRAFNASPGRWLMEKRLNHALHLLTNMGKTVSEAAFESGFESPSHFSRTFKNRFGKAPAEVKKAHLPTGPALRAS